MKPHPPDDQPLSVEGSQDEQINGRTQYKSSSFLTKHLHFFEVNLSESSKKVLGRQPKFQFQS